MSIKHKIILDYIKDLSVETPDPETHNYCKRKNIKIWI